jgi:hypothetical protein
VVSGVESLAGAFESAYHTAEPLINLLKDTSWVRIWDVLNGGGVPKGLHGIQHGAPAAPRASGGPVRPSSTYLVGERGPELFVPSVAGTIVPNGKSSGDVNVTQNFYGQRYDARAAMAEAAWQFRRLRILGTA